MNQSTLPTHQFDSHKSQWWKVEKLWESKASILGWLHLNSNPLLATHVSSTDCSFTHSC